MVIKDISHPETLPRKHEDSVRLAPVSDRALAFFLDALFFSPVISLLAAGTFRQVKTFSLLNPQAPLVMEAWMVWALVVFTGTWFLQAAFYYFWSATPGQKFMQLRVVSWPHPEMEMTFSKALLRSLLWCLSWAFLAIPFLELLGHPFRRALHERASDTLVVTLKEGAEAPFAFETRFINSWINLFFASLALLVFVFSVSAVQFVQGPQKIKEVAAHEANKDSGLCRELKAWEALQSSASAQEKMDRLIALAWANSSGELPCAESELNSHFWDNKTSSQGRQNKTSEKSAELDAWAYLARTVNSVDQKSRRDYVNKACEVAARSEACELGMLILEDQLSLHKLKAMARSSLSAKVLLIETALAEEEVLTAIQQIKELKNEKLLSDFYHKSYVKAVWAAQRKSDGGGRAPSSEPVKPASELKAQDPVLEQILKDFRREFDLQ